LKKDWDAASSALLQHIRKQRPNVTRYFKSLSNRKPTTNNGDKTVG
jgi:hypothetical protein